MADMDSMDGMPADELRGPPAWSWWRWLLAVVSAVLLLVMVLVPASLWWLAETPDGRAFVAARLSRFETESGLRYEVARIDGSLLSRFRLVDVLVHDLDGPLAGVPLLEVEWTPRDLLRGLVGIERLEVPEARLFRKPHLRPTDPDKPLLPDIDIRVDRFEIGRLLLEAPVLGRAESLAASGAADIRSGRLLLDAQAQSTSNDRLLLLLDAEPDRDRFDLKAELEAPADGVLAAFAGLSRPASLRASGAGTWSRWRGRLQADLGEGAGEAGEADGAGGRVRVADLSIAADGGRWRLNGELRPGPFVGDGLAKLVGPELDIDSTAERSGRDVDFRFVASAPALAVTGHARVDSGFSKIGSARVEAVVRTPEALHPALAADGLAASLVAEGALRAPDLRWTVGAKRLRFALAEGAVTANELAASGRLELPNGDEPLRLPFELTTGALAGLPAQAAPLLEAPRLSGTLVYAEGALRSDDLLLRTRALQVRGNGVLESGGNGRASLAARLDRLGVPAVGEAAGTLSARLSWTAAGRLSANGRFDVRLARLESAGISRFLGGLPAASGAFALAADGQLRLTEGHVSSPNLEIRDIKGGYAPESGRFTLDSAGLSRAYGPFTLVASGTPAAPEATLRLPAPGFGVRNVEVGLSPDEDGLALALSGDSSAGPLLAKALVQFAEGEPLTIGVQQASLAGIEAIGTFQQTEAGPFAGRLQADGRGISAALTLFDDNGVQQVDIDARALNARLPLATPIGLARGEALVTLRFPGELPQVKGAFRLQGLNRAGVVLNDVQGAANLDGAGGVATLKATGRSGDGQALAFQSRVQTIAGGYAVSLDGSVGRQPVTLVAPARILRDDNGLALKPARIRLPKGEVELAGRWGRVNELRLGLHDVDLAILDTMRAGLGFGGRADGQLLVRFERRSVLPAGDANLTITGLERAGVTGITVPVDVRLSAHSDDGGLKLGAAVTWQGNSLGRLVLDVDPGAGDTPAERFFSGRLSGGVRYNGPVEPLFALVGSEGQELKGPVAVAADFAGTPAEPTLAGVARASGLVYRNATFGTEITDLGFDGRFTDDSLRITGLRARANGGTIAGRGSLRFGEQPAVNLEVDLDKARLANSDLLDFTLSGPLRVAGRGRQATLSGDLSVDSARVQLVQMANSEVPQLKVRRAGVMMAPGGEETLSARNLALDVRIRADDRVQVEGMGLDSTWRGDIRIRGTAARPEFSGIANLVRGEFVFAGSDFELTSGRVVLNGDVLDSSLDIRAQTQATDVTAVVSIGGTASRPEVRFSSTPTLPEDEILSRLLFGSSVADLSVTEAVQLATAVAGLQSGVDTMGKVRRAVGVDRLRLVSDNGTGAGGTGSNGNGNGVGTGIAVGKRLTRNLYVEVLTGSQGNTLTTLQLTLSRIWSLFLDMSSAGTGSANVRYQREN